MPVPNAPAGRYVPAINPTGNGATVSGVSNAPLSTLPATDSDVIDWDPVAASAPSQGLATTPEITAEAGILDSAEHPVAGSGGPPYVIGNVTLPNDQTGTTVVLPPPVT